MAGGVTGGKKMKSILFGGAAGAFATSEHLDVKMTFEDLRAVGLPLGSGVVMVFDETRDMREVLKRLGRFFAHESCGKCYPCQMGSQRQMEILDRIAAGNPLPDDMIRLQDVGWTMTDASLCGLGQTAAGAVLSAIKLWPELFVDNTLKVDSDLKKEERGKKTAGAKRKTQDAEAKNSVKKSTAKKPSRKKK
jgi:NADH-quinone oxidoreductase subunit F